mgnify:CR=1 FL=1
MGMIVMGRALFVGRFQPLHRGHEYAIEYMLDREDEIIIAIGSAQENYTPTNPLTCGERIEIIWTYLQRRKLLDRCIICSVPDINNNFLWPRHVIALTPKFDIVYSGNPLVLLLFKTMGVPTHKITEIKKDEYSGTVIRNKILRGEKWRHLVPDETIPILDRLNFENRIRMLGGIYRIFHHEKR